MILDTLTEEAVFSKDCKNPVYITLMNGKSPLADIISKATGDYFTHACLSFNSALDPLYSFGSKNDIEKGMGFSIAHVKDKAISRNQPYYSVYVMYVSDGAYAAMKERLKYFEKNKNKFKYDFKGLVDIFFNRSSENHSTKYFCSRFVMDIISQAMPLSKVASLWRPQQIESLSNISLVNRGFDLYNYDKKITERNEKLIKQGKYNEDDIIFESLGGDTQKDYKTKDTLVLNQYAKIKLSDAVVRVYSSRQKSLENIKINNDTKGFIWVDNSNNCVVAVVNTEEKDDGYRWITTFEVFVPYKGKGLSNQLLKVATNELKATNLEVSEDNDLAVKEYKSLGFSQYKKSGKMIYMSLDKSAGDEPEEDDEDYDDEDFEESTIQELKAFKNPARVLKMRHSRKQNIQTKLGNYGGNDNPSSAPDTTPPNQDNNNQQNPIKKKKSNSDQPSQDSSTNESANQGSLEKVAEKARALLTKEIFECKDCAAAYNNIMVPMEDGYAIIRWDLNNLKAADQPSFDRCREAVFGYCKKVFEDTNPGYELLEDLSMNCFYIRPKN